MLHLEEQFVGKKYITLLIRQYEFHSSMLWLLQLYVTYFKISGRVAILQTIQDLDDDVSSYEQEPDGVSVNVFHHLYYLMEINNVYKQ